MRKYPWRSAAVLGLALAAAVAVAAPANATEPGSGSAYGADVDVHLLPSVLGPGGLTVSTGKLAASSTSGPISASALDAALRGLVTAKVITSSSHHSTTDGSVTSNAAIVDAALPVLAPLAGSTPKASVISSQCHADASGITGSSDLADLDLGQIGHVSASTPNLTIGVPGVLSIVANEQIQHADGSLTVNALHIRLLGAGLAAALGSGDIVLASSTCGAATTISTPPTSAQPPTQPEVSVVPAGAPETGDGSLATVIVH
ncbi:MAG TPA: choice-of-anchor P family protein [Pseudonocardiaceae bacterium]|nr:choice-of-anchor P family protein [Pseudonocardiaceae bacterium]